LEDILRNLERMRQSPELRPGQLGAYFASQDLNAGPVKIAVCVSESVVQAGLRPGDQLASVNGMVVERLTHWRHAIGPLNAGDEIELLVLRDGQPVRLSVQLQATIEPLQPRWIGFVPQSGSPELAIGQVLPGSPAESAGLRSGDRIMALDGATISDRPGWLAQLSSVPIGAEVSLQLQRGGETLRTRVTVQRFPAQLPTVEMGERAGEADCRLETPAQAGGANRIFAVIPTPAATEPRRGLLLWIPPPGPLEPDAILTDWEDCASRSRSIVIVVESLDPQRWFPDDASLLADVVRTAQRSYRTDPQRVAIGGEAAGAAMAAWCAAHHSDLFAGLALADWPATAPAPSWKSEPVRRTIVLALLEAGAGEHSPPWLEPFQRAASPVWVPALSEGGGETRQTLMARWLSCLDLR
jgi:hypothetical protein